MVDMRNFFFTSQRQKKAGDRPTFVEVFPETSLDNLALSKKTRAEVLSLINQIQAWKNSARKQPVQLNMFLTGKEGNGKRTLVRAIAAETCLPLVIICAGEWSARPCTESVRLFDHLLQHAEHNPMILLIDRLEQFAPIAEVVVPHANSGENCRRHLLERFRSLAEKKNVILVAASSHPELIDSVLYESGHFREQIALPLPDRPLREEILRIQTQGLRLAHDVHLPALARTTTGLTGKQVTQISHMAAWLASRKGKQEIQMADFEESLEHLLVNGARTALLDDHERRLAAYREAGRAITALFSPTPIPLTGVSILPESNPAKENTEFGTSDGEETHDEMMTRLSILVSGRAAEQVALNETTPRSQAEFDQAVLLARKLTSGRPTYPSNSIDQEANRLLNDQYQHVVSQLQSRQPYLDRVADRLVNDETLEMEDLSLLLGLSSQPDSGEMRKYL